MLTTGPFNATRNPQKPLLQPSYCLRDVPQARRDLTGSTLHIISNTNREQFQKSMAEMLLLCKEAVRRRRKNRVVCESIAQTQHLSSRPRRHCIPQQTSATDDVSGSLTASSSNEETMTSSSGVGNKPLSLEYIADRIDIDDPCFGYIIRTSDSQTVSDSIPWKMGMLQGFITVTTFTNWQRTFRWDSLNEAAYYEDDDEEEGTDELNSLSRKRDVDGSLARELQSTVRCGDIHMEGIVWPRIAEISLLGGLGCGATLISLLIEQLETSPPTVMANYDYLVLQATDNSIPFYESMGFIRVGAIMLDEDCNVYNDNTDVGLCGSQENPFVTSPVMTYHVKNTGETLTRIASKFQVDVWDIIFLNKHSLGTNVRPCDKPKLNALLLIPDKVNEEKLGAQQAYVPTSEIRWHTAKENDTPRTIAKMYNLSTYDVVERNKGRLPGLISSSRLKEGTRVKISHFDVPDNLYKPYAHWSFPDSKYEDPEPSYMMVRKLQRRKVRPNSLADSRPFLSSLKASVTENFSADPAIYLSPLSPLEKQPLPMNSSNLESTSAENDPIIKASLYNKVVRLKPGAMTEGSNYVYWYVLTFIPDLKWCHLAPMMQDGTFGTDKPKAFGRAKWRLVDESLGHEVDLSSSYCIPIKSRSMRKTLDADKEEWDIVDDGTDPTSLIRTSSNGDLSRRSSNSSTQPSHRGVIAIKPSVERYRKKAPVYIAESPSLLATIPGSGRITTVRLIGKSLFGNASNSSSRPIDVNCGRNIGLKNKPNLPRSASDTRSVGLGDFIARMSDNSSGKKHRSSMVQFNVPASARKAAALRTTIGVVKPSGVCSRSPSHLFLSPSLNDTVVDSLKATSKVSNKKSRSSQSTKIVSNKSKRKKSFISFEGIENSSSTGVLQVISEGDGFQTSDDDSVCSSHSLFSLSSQDEVIVTSGAKSRKFVKNLPSTGRRSLRQRSVTSSSNVAVATPTVKGLSSTLSRRRARDIESAVVDTKMQPSRIVCVNPNDSFIANNRPKRKAASLS